MKDRFVETYYPRQRVEYIVGKLSRLSNIKVWGDKYGSLFVKGKNFEIAICPMVERFFIQITGEQRNDEYMDNKIVVRVLPNMTFICGCRL